MPEKKAQKAGWGLNEKRENVKILWAPGQAEGEKVAIVQVGILGTAGALKVPAGGARPRERDKLGRRGRSPATGPGVGEHLRNLEGSGGEGHQPLWAGEVFSSLRRPGICQAARWLPR